MPSMHVYGGAGEGDWQVTGKESADVAAMFAEESREEVVHPGGHFIPCSKPFIKRYKGFLAKMMHQHPAS